jgi:hypothetical protein
MPKTTTHPIIRIHNVETNEVIDREMTDDEFAQYQADQAEQVIAKAEAEAKATARAEILNRLGLTADEAALILG